MWPGPGERAAVLAHVASTGTDPLVAIDVFARGVVRVDDAFVVVTLSAAPSTAGNALTAPGPELAQRRAREPDAAAVALVDVPLGLAGRPDGDFQHLCLALWHAANPATRCAFVQGRAAAFPGVAVYSFVLAAVRGLFEVAVPIAVAMRAQRHDLQAAVARGYLGWLERTQSLDAIEQMLERGLGIHQHFVVHSAAWRDAKAAIFASEASVALSAHAQPGGFSLEGQAFALTPRDATLVLMLLLLRPGAALSAELAAIRRAYWWLDDGDCRTPGPARCLSVLGPR